MNNIIYAIFDTLVSDISNMEQADKIITEEVCHLLEPYKERLTAEEMEELSNLVFNCTYTAKRELFVVGFYFALELLLNRKL